MQMVITSVNSHRASGTTNGEIVTFSLVVDNFGTKTVGLTHAKHLKDTLQKFYNVVVEWTGK